MIFIILNIIIRNSYVFYIFMNKLKKQQILFIGFICMLYLSENACNIKKIKIF